MKKNKTLVYLIMIMVVFIPISVFAVDMNEYLNKVLPKFSTSFVGNYSEYYDCSYRLVMEEESPIWSGHFDLVITFSKLGGAKNIVVSQSSENADWTYRRVNKLITENNIPNKIYYAKNKGYYCPDLMAYLTDKQHKTDAFRDGIFKVAEYDNKKYKANKEKMSINIWYKIHNFKEVSYDCRASSENECKKNQNCNWVLVDFGHKDYSCLEKQYNTKQDSEQKDQDKTRVEACKGYEEDIFEKTIEYSFSTDGKLNVNEGGGSSLDFFGGDQYLDKENQLYDLWKEGKCCTKEKLGVHTDYKDGKWYMTLSCDGSESTWNYETPEGEDSDSGEYEDGTPVTGCEVVPEVVRKWVNNILKFVRYVALALVIALGALDFMKAAGSGDAESMKKAGQTFMKRMIAVVILFLLPVIVDFILNMINIYGVDKNNIDCL